MSAKRTFLLLGCVCTGLVMIYNYETVTIMHAGDISPRYYSALDLYTKYNKYRNQPNSPFPRKLKPFLPPINRQQQEQIREMFFASTKLLKQLGIPYMLIHGSLLGSYLYHNMIPWDEDLDVLVHFKHLVTLQAAFKNDSIVTVNNIRLKFKAIGKTKGLWKIYPVFDRIFTDSFRNKFWPFLDLFPYTDNGTHVVQVSSRNKVMPMDILFPVQWRPFEGSLQPVPCDTEYVIKKILFPKSWTKCVSRSYNHLMRKRMIDMPLRIPCKKLHRYYPFVSRTILSDNKHVLETITIDGTIVENNTFEIPTCGTVDNNENM